MIEIAGGILLAIFLLVTIRFWLPLLFWLVVIGIGAILLFVVATSHGLV